MLDDKKEPEFKVTFETLPGNGMRVEADIKFWPRKSELPENLKDLDPELQKRIVDKHLTQKEANASRNMGILQAVATMWMQHNAHAETQERDGNVVRGPWPNSGPGPTIACVRPGCTEEVKMVFAGLPFCVRHEEEAHTALEEERAEEARAAEAEDHEELDDEENDEGPAS